MGVTCCSSGQAKDDPTRTSTFRWSDHPTLIRSPSDPADDVAPMWSSDGRQIAYVRRGPGPFSGHVRVMSSLGDSDRQVSDFLVSVPAAWSPDDRYLVAGWAAPPDATHPTNGLYLIPVPGGEPRPLTQPPPPGADRTPTFSPDGRRLAYVSCAGPSIRTACHVNVLDVDSAFAPAGSPRRVTQVPDTTIMGLAWSRDGKSVIYGAEELSVDFCGASEWTASSPLNESKWRGPTRRFLRSRLPAIA